MSAAVRPVFTEKQAEAVVLGLNELLEGMAGDQIDSPSRRGLGTAAANAMRQINVARRETARRKRGSRR